MSRLDTCHHSFEESLRRAVEFVPKLPVQVHAAVERGGKKDRGEQVPNVDALTTDRSERQALGGPQRQDDVGRQGYGRSIIKVLDALQPASVVPGRSETIGPIFPGDFDESVVDPFR